MPRSDPSGQPRSGSRARPQGSQTQPSRTWSWLRGLWRLISPLFRLLREIVDLFATLLLWLVELLARTIALLAGVLGQAFGVLLNLLIWMGQGLVSPVLGRSQQLSPEGIAARSLRAIGLAVTAFFLANLLPVLIPLQLSNPLWYLGICRAVVGNGVILIFALFCLCLGLSWDAGATASPGRRVLWAARAAITLFLVLLPVQLVSSAVLLGQIRTTQANRLTTVESRRDQAIEQVERLRDPQALVAIYRRFTPGVTTLPSTNLPLAQLRREVALSLGASAETAKQEIQQQRRAQLLGFAVDVARLAISLLALSLAGLGLSRWAAVQPQRRPQGDDPST